MTMVTISPSWREVSPAEQLHRSPRLVLPRFRLVAVEFRPVSFLMIFSRAKDTLYQKMVIGGLPGGPQGRGRAQGGRARWWGWPSGGHLLLYGVFRWEKNHKPSSRMKLRRHEAEPWQNQSRAPAELFCWETSLREGEIIAIVITNSSHREGVNLHQHLPQHHLLSNPSSSLVSNHCPKASDWYLWVASSVDYSL